MIAPVLFVSLQATSKKTTANRLITVGERTMNRRELAAAAAQDELKLTKAFIRRFEHPAHHHWRSDSSAPQRTWPRPDRLPANTATTK